jgi:hypothetical protein
MEVRYSTPVIATGALTCLPALGNSGWTPALAFSASGEKAIGFITTDRIKMRSVIRVLTGFSEGGCGLRVTAACGSLTAPGEPEESAKLKAQREK